MSKSPEHDEVGALVGRMKSATAPFRRTLDAIYQDCLTLTQGSVADYIPELARANPESFAISVVTADGLVFDVGDSELLFSIQSVSKPFVFGMALQDRGRDEVLAHVNVEPTGEAFNAILLDEVTNRPFNPMVNAGAIATVDLINGVDFPERVRRMLEMFGLYCGHDVYVDNATFFSERLTGHRNRAIAHLMLNFDMISDRVDETLELYFQQCSVLVNSRDLAVMGATLANAGVNPLTGHRALSSEYVKDVLSIMLSCGMYDYAGEWQYRVGLPAKSGVSGGIVVVLPGVGGIGVYSPRLDPKGNSVRGVAACRALSERFGLHVFECGGQCPSLADELRLSRRNP